MRRDNDWSLVFCLDAVEMIVEGMRRSHGDGVCEGLVKVVGWKMRRAIHWERFTVHGAWTSIRTRGKRIMIRHEGVMGVCEDVATIVPDIRESGSAGHCDIVEVTHGRLDMVVVSGLGYIGPACGLVNVVSRLVVVFYIDVMVGDILFWYVVIIELVEKGTS